MRWTRSALLLSVVLAAARARAAPPALKDGDLVHQRSRSTQSALVGTLTGSDLTHVGVVFHRRGRPRVLEAAQRVRSRSLEAWIRAGRGRFVVVQRLRARDRIPRTTWRRMRAVARGFVGRPYDLRFEWSDERLYCSELVYKVFRRGAGIALVAPARVGDFDLDDPLVRRAIRARFDRPPRRDEPVVTPAQLLDSPHLETVFAGRWPRPTDR